MPVAIEHMLPLFTLVFVPFIKVYLYLLLLEQLIRDPEDNLQLSVDVATIKHFCKSR